MRDFRFRWLAVLIGGALLPCWMLPVSATVSSVAPPTDVEAEAEEQTAGEQQTGYLRVVDEPGKSISLEIASRRFIHEDDSKPTIALVSVAHIADQSFYDGIAGKLSEYDVVLYEAVAPAGVRSGEGDTRVEKIESTRQALRFVASMVEQYRAARSKYPADLASLEAYVDTLAPMVRNWFSHAITDPWGQRLVYKRTDGQPRYELFSVGPPEEKEDSDDADGSPVTDRILFTEHGSIHPMPSEDDNLQKQLADALGLAYQLESLPYESSNWIISDMTAEALFSAFSGTEVDFEMFSGTLTGTSLPARLVGMMLRMISVLDAMYDGAVSDMVKVLFIEILGDEQVVQASMKQMGADFARILIDERNQIVIDDVAALIENRPGVESIAILYGAAHMPDLAERLTDQLGYVEAREDDAAWLQAISVDLAESRIDQRQLMQMRSMVRRMMRSPAMRSR